MSIKTLRKRIALVAVSALGVGLLSVAPANAGAGELDVVEATGYCAALTSAGGAATLGTVTAPSDVASIVLAVGGTITVSQDTAVNSTFRLSGTNGLVTATGTIAKDANDSLSQTTTADGDTVTFTFNATGSNRITLTADSAPTTTTAAISVTVVQSCATGTWSINNSFIENQVSGAVTVADDNVDDTPFWTNGQTAIIGMRIRNAYAGNVRVGTWVVSATNGALVGITSGGNTTAPSCGSTSTASVVGTGADIKVGICQGTDYAAQLSTVTVSYGSTTILTKTVLITGDVARIDVNTVETGKTGTVNFRTFKASAYDAAGNRVAVNPSADASTLDQNVTAADIGTTSVSADIQDTNTFTCGTGAKGSTNVVFQVTAASGATVKSAPVKLTCASTTRTYTAALDKAVYAPGDIATLTITAKDSNGAAPFDSHKTASTGAADDTFNYVNGSNVTPSISGSQMTPVAALAAADEFAGGVKKYTFIVGSTEGSYQMAVNLTGITTDTAKTVAYQVKSPTTTVTNAEVLASIVKLIASINKQIRALQKSLRR